MENPDRWLNLWEMIIEQLSCVMSKHGIFKKKDIDHEHYNITFKFSYCAPKHDGLYGDCGVWVCIIMYRLANGLSMDFPPGQHVCCLHASGLDSGMGQSNMDRIRCTLSCMSTRSSSSNLVPPSSDPESIIQNRRQNLGDPSLLLDFEEINMANNINSQGPPPVGPNIPAPDLRPIEELL
ncbi:hypothetical protein Tco_0800397 [Tanacetum coccineum]|uniref:Ubiquitin-like protease family profile domain-containing protein n=1 Tax=Tanacetum coccineum TaxID=301880 RepID=A0ABQ4ZT38_9ASTR